MPAIDPYKEATRFVNQKKREAAGPPDLKKPFVRDRKGRKKPDPEPEPEEYQDDDEFNIDDDPDLERDTTGDDLPDMPGEGQYVELEQPRIPEQPMSTAYIPPPAQPQYDVTTELDKQVKLFYTYNLYMRKYLETFKKYLTYQKGLILEQDDINEAVSKGMLPASASSQQQPTAKKTPVQSLANDPRIVSEEEQKKNKRNGIIKLGLGVMMIGGGVYSAILAQLAPIVVIAFLLTGMGSALLIGAVMK